MLAWTAQGANPVIPIQWEFTLLGIGVLALLLLGILAAKQMGAERIIAMSRHADRQAWPASLVPPIL